jgi:hypothetical protein
MRAIRAKPPPHPVFRELHHDRMILAPPADDNNDEEATVIQQVAVILEDEAWPDAEVEPPRGRRGLFLRRVGPDPCAARRRR